MKIEGNRSTGAVRSVAAAAYARRTGTAEAAGATEPAEAVTSVMGIPESEFTPRVRDAVMGLMQEVESLDEVEKAADRDGMLPLLNRRAFVRELARYIALTGRYNTPASLIYFDLNDLKRTNDTHGHAAGDAVLAHFADVLVAHVRESDSVGRLGGDEFGVLLSHANLEQASKKADALAEALQGSPTRWLGKTIPVSFAYGAFQLNPGDNPDLAMARADEAMYRQKRQAKTAAG